MIEAERNKERSVSISQSRFFSGWRAEFEFGVLNKSCFNLAVEIF